MFGSLNILSDLSKSEFGLKDKSKYFVFDDIFDGIFIEYYAFSLEFNDPVFSLSNSNSFIS